MDARKDDQTNNSMVNKREKYTKNTISNGVYFGMLPSRRQMKV